MTGAVLRPGCVQGAGPSGQKRRRAANIARGPAAISAMEAGFASALPP